MLLNMYHLLYLCAHLWICLTASSILNDQPNNSLEVHELYLPDETVLRILSFLPVTQMTRMCALSRQFNKLSNYLLDLNFKSIGPDGELGFDLCKMYDEYRRIDTELAAEPTDEWPHRYLANEHNIMEKYIERCLNERRVSAWANVNFSKFHASFSNVLTNVFIKQKSRPIGAMQITCWNDKSLAELFVKYAVLEGKFRYIFPREIILFGLEFVRSRFDTPLELPFIKGLKELQLDRETRTGIINIFKNASVSMRAIVESHDIMDPRIMKNEVGLLELCYLDSLVVDEESCNKVLELSEDVLERTNLDCMIFLAVKYLNSALLISKLAKRARIGHLKNRFTLFMMESEHFDEFYRLINDVEEILKSISLCSDNYSPFEKIQCGIVVGLEDEVLISITKAADFTPILRELIWMAVKKRRSKEFVKALQDKLPGRKWFPQLCLDLDCARDGNVLEMEFDCSPDEIENYCELSVGDPDDWIYNLSRTALYHYGHHLFDTRHKFEQNNLFRLIGVADESLFEKIIRYNMATGNDERVMHFISHDDYELIALKYVKNALEDGIFPHKFFPNPLNLCAYHVLLLNGIFSVKNGFEILIKGEENAGLEPEFFQFNEDQTKTRTDAIIQFCLNNEIDMEFGSFCNNQEFKDLFVLSMLSNFENKPILEINMDDYPVEVIPVVISNILEKYPTIVNALENLGLDSLLPV